MLKKEFINTAPAYVDGIEKLHKQLFDASEKAIKLSNMVMGTSLSTELKRFSIFVDYNEEQPQDKLKGYFIFNKIIHRFLPVTFDLCLLFPVTNHRQTDIKYTGRTTYSKIQRWKDNRKQIRLTFMLSLDDENKPFYRVSPFVTDSLISDISDKTLPPAHKIDDIGLPVFSFPDIECLKVINIPEKFIEKSYKLTGKQYYAPYTTKDEVYCVLYAQLDNEHDPNAIKVMRWLPVSKGKEIDQAIGLAPDGGDIFFEMGYISREENSELHAFMVDGCSRVLFGKCSEDIITILGGVKMFQENDLKYPKCLYNIKLK